MKENYEELVKYIERLRDYTLPNYNDLPKIPLYMEQVTSYISDVLKPFFKDDSSNIITPYMVNNYVKAKIVNAPKEKKYDTNQIGYFIFISLLKNSANMRNLAALIEVDNQIYKSDKSELYSLFKEIFEDETNKELSQVIKRLELINTVYERDSEEFKDDNFNLNIANLALKLYVSSGISKVLADALMNELNKEVLPVKALKNNNIEHKIEKVKIKKEADQLKVR